MEEQQAVFVYLPWIDFDRLLVLTDELLALLEDTSIGKFDGNEIDDETTTLFFYGPDAEALFAYVWPCLTQYPFCEGARVTLRLGPIGGPTRGASI